MHPQPAERSNPNPEATTHVLQQFCNVFSPNRLDCEAGPARYITFMVGRLSMGNLVDRQILLSMYHDGGVEEGVVFAGMFSTLDLGGSHEPQVYTADAQAGSYEVAQPPRLLGNTDEVERLGLILQMADFCDTQPLRTLQARILAGQYPEPWQATCVTDKRPLFES